MTVAHRSTAAAALPPVTRAHQQALRQQLATLQEHGLDVRWLQQLVESVPAFRSGLSTNDRLRIEELEGSADSLSASFTALQQAIEQFDELQADPRHPEQGINMVDILFDVDRLSRIAESAQLLAETANDLALRATERCKLL